MSFFIEMEHFRCVSVFATLVNKLNLMCILAHPKRIKTHHLQTILFAY